MTWFTKIVVAISHSRLSKGGARRTTRPASRLRLGVEVLDERVLPSASPLATGDRLHVKSAPVSLEATIRTVTPETPQIIAILAVRATAPYQRHAEGDRIGTSASTETPLVQKDRAAVTTETPDIQKVREAATATTSGKTGSGGGAGKVSLNDAVAPQSKNNLKQFSESQDTPLVQKVREAVQKVREAATETTVKSHEPNAQPEMSNHRGTSQC